MFNGLTKVHQSIGGKIMTYFKNINNIQFEGSESTNPFAFKFYNPKEKVGKKTKHDNDSKGLKYYDM